MKIRCPQCMRISEIPHVEHGRIAICSCQNTFRIDGSTVVEEFSLPDLKPPEFIGRYRIVRYIGRGATNCVYEGIHPDFGIPAAIKTMLPEYSADKQACERFLHAAKISAKAVHPNIVKVYEAGRDANGVPFLAMEFLSGGTLADRIDGKGRFSARETAEIGAAICRALTETAKRGIVHRDIKPDNIMISADGTYKLTDLGLAKLDASAVNENAAHVLDESELNRPLPKTSFGTLEYMSPEQHIDTESCDIRSDIYSLGITLYQLAAGRLPFEPRTRSELRHMHLSVEPIVPSTYVPDLPLDFDYIVIHCIQKRPEDRYRTPEELLADLEAFLAGAPLPSTTSGAVPVSLASDMLRSPEAGNRHYLLLPAIIVLSILILVFAGALFLKRQKLASGTPGIGTRQQTESVLQASESAGLAVENTEPEAPPLIPSNKALDDAGITIIDREADAQTSSYFDDAKATAARALEEKSGFGKAIEDLESFTSPGDYHSEEAKSLIFVLKKASADAVADLMEKLDQKAAPLIRAHEWDGAVNVYLIDIGPLAPESLEARERKVGEIRRLRQEAGEKESGPGTGGNLP